MLMMRVMDMAVGVLHGCMFMLVFMDLSEVKPNTYGHQESCDDHLRRDLFM